jgi:DNA-binding transcriptional regulator YhcF (GntR family)
MYLQLAAAIRQCIERGNLPVGSLVPSLKTLQSEFGVSRITARQAMDRLEDKGLISRHKGRGTFVISNGVERHWLHLRTHWEPCADQNIKFLCLHGNPLCARRILGFCPNILASNNDRDVQGTPDRPHSRCRFLCMDLVFYRSDNTRRHWSALVAQGNGNNWSLICHYNDDSRISRSY